MYILPRGSFLSLTHLLNSYRGQKEMSRVEDPINGNRNKFCGQNSTRCRYRILADYHTCLSFEFCTLLHASMND